ncbi:hypothetical protein O5541_06720 [Escherichia coli]|nr:hypothetical protein [Escherichia coli]
MTVKALADRLAEALRSISMSVCVKSTGACVPNENLSNEELIRENHQRHPSGTGLSGLLRTAGKATIWEPLEVEKHTGMKLTESFAMRPAHRLAGTSATRTAGTCAVAQIQRDQVEDYARRKGMSVTEVERWLAPNLGMTRTDSQICHFSHNKQGAQ